MKMDDLHKVELQKRLMEKILKASEAIREAHEKRVEYSFVVTPALLKRVMAIYSCTEEEAMQHIRDILEGKNVKFNESLAKIMNLNSNENTPPPPPPPRDRIIKEGKFPPKPPSSTKGNQIV